MGANERRTAGWLPGAARALCAGEVSLEQAGMGRPRGRGSSRRRVKPDGAWRPSYPNVSLNDAVAMVNRRF
jgi:hypothetical protein